MQKKKENETISMGSGSKALKKTVLSLLAQKEIS
jgi:hypothetical protein